MTDQAMSPLRRRMIERDSPVRCARPPQIGHRIAVRFTPISRPQQDRVNATLCATTGLMHRSKNSIFTQSSRRRESSGTAALRGQVPWQFLG
jgi:hypothetical protein